MSAGAGSAALMKRKIMIDRRLVENFDWSVLLAFFFIVLLGLINLYSALYQQIQADATGNPFFKQVVWLGLGFVGLVASLFLDYQRLKEVSLWIYMATVLMLVAVLIVGKEINGAQSWLAVGGFRWQPSEFMKIAIVIQLATLLSSQEVTPYPSLKHLVLAAAVTAVPVLLVLAQPDLGTAVTILLIAGTVIFFMGIRLRYLISAVILFVPMVWPIWQYVLKPYQKWRILILIWPELDPLGAGYHIRQSKIAIGSGMLWGKGFLQGTQNKLRFLPEKHTDFIFSVWAEEWGFVGCFLFLALFGVLVFCALKVSRRSKDRFGTLLVVGMTALILWQMVINIGMVIGLFPVVGITLPFVSYGGSSLITLCLAIGLIENVSMRRYVFQSK